MKKPKFLMTTDEKIEALGFRAVAKNEFGARYEREIKISDTHSYTQIVDIHFKSKENDYILQSYDPSLFDTFTIGNTCVGLFGKELDLFNKKVKELNHAWDPWII